MFLLTACSLFTKSFLSENNLKEHGLTCYCGMIVHGIVNLIVG